MKNTIDAQFSLFYTYVEEIGAYEYLTDCINELLNDSIYIHSLLFNLRSIDDQLNELDLNFKYLISNKEYLNESSNNILNELHDNFLIIRMKYETNKKIISLKYKTILKEL